jgi:tetratricopeptide (TPR) repeat protein
MPPDTYWCSACGKLNASFRARLDFLAMIVGVLLGIGVTSRYVAYLKDFESSLGHRWFVRGQQAMQQNQPGIAIDDYRNALGYDSSDPMYRQRLAEALVAMGQLAEARSYLMGLWTQSPADGEVNLDLARLYVREDKPESAVRHYRMAVDGVWDQAALQHRIDTRLELVQYLLKQGAPARTTAELIALQAEAPDDAVLQLTIGKLFLQLGDNSRATKAFETVLKRGTQNAEAWSGEGRAALAEGDYRKAVRALATAASLDPSKGAGGDAQELELARAALDADPSLRTLSLEQRANRVASAFDLAMGRLQACSVRRGIALSPALPQNSAPKAPAAESHNLDASATGTAPAPDSLQLLYESGTQRRAAAGAKALQKNPDSLATTMQFVYQVFRTADAACPAGSLRERAMALLARHEPEELR